MAQTAIDHKVQWETVSRVVYPVKDADLTLPLYAVNWNPSHFDASVFDERDSMTSVELNAISRSDFSNLVARGNRPLPDDPHGFTVDTRSSITLEPDTHISLCTYFNAFPAGYWRRWTCVKQLRFLAEATGKGTLTLFRSTARGLSSPVQTFTIGSIDSKTAERIEATLTLKGMLDGICALIGAVDGVELFAQFRLVGDGPELIQAI